MTKLLYTQNDVFFYLVEKRDSILSGAREAQDLENADGAKALSLAAEQLTAIIKSIMPSKI